MRHRFASKTGFVHPFIRFGRFRLSPFGGVVPVGRTMKFRYGYLLCKDKHIPHEVGYKSLLKFYNAKNFTGEKSQADACHSSTNIQKNKSIHGPITHTYRKIIKMKCFKTNSFCCGYDIPLRRVRTNCTRRRGMQTWGALSCRGTARGASRGGGRLVVAVEGFFPCGEGGSAEEVVGRSTAECGKT